VLTRSSASKKKLSTVTLYHICPGENIYGLNNYFEFGNTCKNQDCCQNNALVCQASVKGTSFLYHYFRLAYGIQFCKSSNDKLDVHETAVLFP
jgi:hypothetical protein